MRLATIGVVAVLAACGGGSAPESATSSAETGSVTPASSECGGIAAEYSSALLDAMRCDPGASDPCGAQYPLAVKECDAKMNCSFQSICWTAYVGYVNPARTAGVDEMIRRYRAAGCAVAACPGPPPHVTRCVQNRAGVFTCGGN